MKESFDHDFRDLEDDAASGNFYYEGVVLDVRIFFFGGGDIPQLLKDLYGILGAGAYAFLL